MNFKNWTLRFGDDKSWQISSSTKQVLLTKVGPLAKESIAGLASTLLLCHQGIDSDELWKRRSVRSELTENWIKSCINISTCPPCAKVWWWHGFWGSPYSHQTGSCSWPGQKTIHFLCLPYVLPSGHWAHRSWAGHQSWQSGHPETWVSQSAKCFRDITCASITA